MNSEIKSKDDQLYSSIEIELKLSDNEYGEKDKFINIP